MEVANAVMEPAADWPEITDFERRIYERQIQDPTFGEQGQRILKGSTVMISRVGGLGGTVAMLLARAGVGRFVLAHDGEVEHENLNRMHLALRKHLGQPRIEAFRETLAMINPDLKVESIPDNVTGDNVVELVSRADVVVDAAPLFEERYHMNREAVRQGKPLVMAGMFGLEGYVTTIKPGETPCLSCIFPDPPEGWHLRVFPVITPSPVMIATVAAMEVIKLLTGSGDLLTGKLFYCDLSSNTYRTMAVTRRDDCEVCGSGAD